MEMYNLGGAFAVDDDGIRCARCDRLMTPDEVLTSAPTLMDDYFEIEEIMQQLQRENGISGDAVDAVLRGHRTWICDDCLSIWKRQNKIAVCVRPGIYSLDEYWPVPRDEFLTKSKVSFMLETRTARYLYNIYRRAKNDERVQVRSCEV